MDALLSFFAHALLYFLFQVLHLVVGDRHVDVMNELVLGARLFADYAAFLYEMDFNAPFFNQNLERESVRPVPVETARLLDQHNATGIVGPE